MKKLLFVIANYKDSRQQFFEENFSPRNQKYADIHGYEYKVSKGGELFRGNPTWWKFTLINEMILNGELKIGDEVLHMDADMRIDKFDIDYPCEKSFSVAIDNGNTFCMGSYKLKVNEWTIQLIKNILDETLWNKRKNDPHWLSFREQAAFYTLCGIIPHSWISFLSLPNYGWHQNKSEDTKYSIEELNDNIQILGPEWNTTLLDEESHLIGSALMKYNIVKSKINDTIIRHFAGGQAWRIV
jgi:hypothetical protein